MFDAREFTKSVLGGPTVAIGKTYLHPQDGPVRITDGEWWGTYGLSNFWFWTVLSTGEAKKGYAGAWPEIKAPETAD
jgi:hypothetical protein